MTKPSGGGLRVLAVATIVIGLIGGRMKIFQFLGNTLTALRDTVDGAKSPGGMLVNFSVSSEPLKSTNRSSESQAGPKLRFVVRPAHIDKLKFDGQGLPEAHRDVSSQRSNGRV